MAHTAGVSNKRAAMPTEAEAAASWLITPSGSGTKTLRITMEPLLWKVLRWAEDTLPPALSAALSSIIALFGFTFSRRWRRLRALRARPVAKHVGEIHNTALP